MVKENRERFGPGKRPTQGTGIVHTEGFKLLD